MEELPVVLLETAPEDALAAMQEWWTNLAPADRAEVAGLYDERWESCFFGPTADNPPTVQGGRFLADDDAWRAGTWLADWREFLVEHPDVVLATQFRTVCLLGDVARCRVADWGLTRFPMIQRPPSEQRHAEAAAAPDTDRA